MVVINLSTMKPKTTKYTHRTVLDIHQRTIMRLATLNLPTRNISPSRQSSRSGGTTNVTVCALVRSFKAFASYKYTYWQYTVSQQHVAAIDWEFQSQLALQRENFQKRRPNSSLFLKYGYSSASSRSSCLVFLPFKLDKSFSHHEAAAIFLLFDKSSDPSIELCICACSVQYFELRFVA